MRVVSPDEMKEIEKVAFEKYGLSESLIIENVGLNGAQFLNEAYLKELHFGEIVFLIGKGNNGADGLSIARHLARFGFTTRAFTLFTEDEWTDELTHQAKMALEFGVKITPIKRGEQLEEYFTSTQEDYFVVDAIFGTGVKLPLSDFLFDAIRVSNKYATYMIAIDIASGVNGETGEAGAVAINATNTLAIGVPKRGHYISQGAYYTGKMSVIDAGFPSELMDPSSTNLLTKTVLAGLYRKRNKFAHKNRFGHALVIGGSPGLTGALSMASEAALKVGTGLVTAVTWKESYSELVGRSIPEIMLGTIPEDESPYKKQEQEIQKYDCVIIGPGLGRSPQARKVVLDILNYYAGPLVIDADALNVLNLKEDLQFLSMRKAITVLTPHAGEFSRFIGKDVQDILDHPIEFLRECVDETGCTILLKGASSYLGLPNGKTYINYHPNDGMATGGSGDVLAGIIGGLLSQVRSDMESHGETQRLNFSVMNQYFFNAVCTGVGLHSLSGKHAAMSLGERFMTARSLVEYLADALFEVESMPPHSKREHYHLSLKEFGI